MENLLGIVYGSPWPIFNVTEVNHDDLYTRRGVFHSLNNIFEFCWRRTSSSKVENRRDWFFDMSKNSRHHFRSSWIRPKLGLFQRLDTHSTVSEALMMCRMCTIFRPLSITFDQWEPGILSPVDGIGSYLMFKAQASQAADSWGREGGPSLVGHICLATLRQRQNYIITVANKLLKTI